MSSEEHPRARRAKPSDAGALAEVLARAFEEDPVAIFLFPRAERRRTILPYFFRLQLLHNYLPRGEVLTTEACVGASLWMPPAPPAPGLLDRLAHLAFLPALRDRAGATRRLTLALEARRPAVPHYYLGTIGTDPDHRHRGVASALITPVLDSCDAVGLPAYLECSRLETTGFYAKFGFEVTEVIEAPMTGEGGPRLWLMWRPGARR